MLYLKVFIICPGFCSENSATGLGERTKLEGEVSASGEAAGLTLEQC